MIKCIFRFVVAYDDTKRFTSQLPPSSLAPLEHEQDFLPICQRAFSTLIHTQGAGFNISVLFYMFLIYTKCAPFALAGVATSYLSYYPFIRAMAMHLSHT